jgi:hypothetical protein
MKFLEHYFMNRIDDALDHAQPLDGWTAWYVRRNPKLWEYYTEMIQIELELRFSVAEFVNEARVLSNDSSNGLSNGLANDSSNGLPNGLSTGSFNDPANPQQNYLKNGRLNRRRNYLFKNRLWISTAVILFALLAVWAFHRFSGTKTNVPETSAESAKDQKIDLADVFGELVFAAKPLTELVSPIKNLFEYPMENPFENSFESSFENSLLKFPVDPIVRFTDCPLESTLTFLETTGIVRSSNHECD